MPRTVLVVPAGTEIGLEIAESLAFSKHWRLVAGNSIRDHSEALYHEGIFDLPFVTDRNFASAVRRAAEQVQTDFVIPAHDEASFILASADLGEATFVGPRSDLAQILRFKSKTYDALGNVVPCPRVIDPSELSESKLPVFAKPDSGQGSRGARRVATMSDLEAAAANRGMLFTEYLTGPEYTVDCFTTRTGELAYASARLRERVSNGISVRAREAELPQLPEMAGKISEALNIRGAWFFQAKADASGTLKLLEVANRVSGTMGFQRERGVNLIEGWLHDLEGKDVSFLHWNHGETILERALTTRMMWDYRPSSVYVDFDDTLVLPNGKLNYRLVGQLYGLKANVGAKIVLVTRHQAEIEIALDRLGLAPLFDEIRHLRQGEPKSDAVTDTQAIFIDDSFAERREVSKAKGIPTFSLEGLACIEGINHAALAGER